MIGAEGVIIIDDERRKAETLMMIKAREISKEFDQLFDAKLREERKNKTWVKDKWRK